MSLSGLAYMPHPPIIMPEVGKGEEKAITQTIRAMKHIGEEFRGLSVDTILLFSPHGYIQSEYVGWAANEKFQGDFADFGAPEVCCAYGNDGALVETLCSRLEGTQPYMHPGDTCILDHGALVPLYFIPAATTHSLVYGGYCYRDLGFHFRYGQKLGQLIKSISKKIYIIASGDLSHRLSREAPAGYHADAHTFDDLIVRIVSHNAWDELLTISPELIENAGECGLRSLAMLGGIAETLAASLNVLSYEAPFGVGYMVAKSSNAMVSKKG